MIDELRALVSDILGVNQSRIVPECGPGSLDNWDSLAHLSIITAVEERFGVRFGMNEIRAIDSFGALSTALSDRLAR
ncbi:MAG: acyl carrier protein [Steroidobacteraceae bacterium]